MAFVIFNHLITIFDFITNKLNFIEIGIMNKRKNKIAFKAIEDINLEESKVIASRTLSYDGQIFGIHLDTPFIKTLKPQGMLALWEDVKYLDSKIKIIDIKKETMNKQRNDLLKMWIHELICKESEWEWDNQ